MAHFSILYGFVHVTSPLTSASIKDYICCHSLQRRGPRCGLSKPTVPAKLPSVTSVPLGSNEFRRIVAGEWAGYEVSFDPRTGMALDIDEVLVPDAFRQWGVRVLGFDVRTSCSVNGDSTALIIKRTRALPTVGCEADAVIADVKEDVYLHEGLFVFDDGSFSVGGDILGDESKWIMALMTGKGERVRLEYGRVDLGKGKVTMFQEKWDGEWCNGDILPGCGGGVQSFGDEEKSHDARNFAGEWTVSTSERILRDNAWESENRIFMESRCEREANREVNVILPKGVSIGIFKTLNNSTIVRTAVVYKEAFRLVLEHEYNSNSRLMRVAHRHERRDAPVIEK